MRASLLRIATGLGALLLAAPVASAAPTAEVHGIEFRIHVDLVFPQAAQSLADYQLLLAEALGSANRILTGHQGPIDSACCTEIEASTSLVSFGTPGDGFDVIESGSEVDALEIAFGSGTPENPIAYIVLSLQGCGNVIAPSLLGCAVSPGDTFVVDLDRFFSAGSFESSSRATSELGLTIAHERGHNAGLVHPDQNMPPEVDVDLCRMMSAAGGGGCLADFECNAFRADEGTVPGTTCTCLQDTVGAAPLADGTTCEDSGLCSGGLCGSVPGEAEFELITTGGTESAETAVADDLILMSPLTAGWLPEVALGAEIAALVHDPDSGGFFAIANDDPNDDQLLHIAVDGETTLLGSLDRDNIVSLAWGPGRAFLYATDGTIFSDLLSIDPADGSVTTLGGLDTGITGATANGVAFDGVQSLAYDPATGTLWGSSALGLLEIDPACPVFCATSIADEGEPESRFAFHFGLEIDAARGVLYGIEEAGRRLGTDYEVLGNLGRIQTFELATGEITSLEHQAFTPSALAIAAHPLPEPDSSGAALAVVGTLVALTARRTRRVAA